DEQCDDRTDDGANDARGLECSVSGVLVCQRVADEAADERTDDTEHDCGSHGHGVLAWHQCAGDESGDESDDDEIEDETDHCVLLCVEEDGTSVGMTDVLPNVRRDQTRPDLRLRRGIRCRRHSYDAPTRRDLNPRRRYWCF